MKNTPILDTIEPEIVETLVSRRDAIAKGAGMSSTLVAGLALGSIPVALAALSRTAWAQNAPAAVLDVLEFAFLLENLEAEFYKAVISAPAFATVRGTLIAGDLTAFTTIRDHEIAHVNFLRDALVANGRTPATYTAASFDFTGGNGSGTGPFLAATTTRAVLLGAAQAFEDTGVRAYKGQAGNLFVAPMVLQQALTIHSVEARHAAKIRKMRATTAGASVKASGTITRNQSGIALGNAGDAVVAQIYAGEENTQHIVFNGTAAATLDANTYAGTAFGGLDAATEAFDEPLTKEQVTAIVNPFIVGGPA